MLSVPFLATVFMLLPTSRVAHDALASFVLCDAFDSLSIFDF